MIWDSHGILDWALMARSRYAHGWQSFHNAQTAPRAPRTRTKIPNKTYYLRCHILNDAEGGIGFKYIRLTWNPGLGAHGKVSLRSWMTVFPQRSDSSERCVQHSYTYTYNHTNCSYTSSGRSTTMTGRSMGIFMQHQRDNKEIRSIDSMIVIVQC
jgi:hypothetical protein